MRTQEELDILYAKFDKDVLTKNRGWGYINAKIFRLKSNPEGFYM